MISLAVLDALRTLLRRPAMTGLGAAALTPVLVAAGVLGLLGHGLGLEDPGIAEGAVLRVQTVRSGAPGLLSWADLRALDRHAGLQAGGFQIERGRVDAENAEPILTLLVRGTSNLPELLSSTFPPVPGDRSGEMAFVDPEMWRGAADGNLNLGDSLEVDGNRYVVAGFLPSDRPRLLPGLKPWLWILDDIYSAPGLERARTSRTVHGVIRPVRAGSRPGELAAEVARERVAAGLAEKGLHYSVTPWQQDERRGRGALQLVRGVVYGGGLLLVVLVSLNLASLVLAQFHLQERGYQTRVALGAPATTLRILALSRPFFMVGTAALLTTLLLLALVEVPHSLPVDAGAGGRGGILGWVGAAALVALIISGVLPCLSVLRDPYRTEARSRTLGTVAASTTQTWLSITLFAALAALMVRLPGAEPQRLGFRTDGLRIESYTRGKGVRDVEGSRPDAVTSRLPLAPGHALLDLEVSAPGVGLSFPAHWAVVDNRYFRLLEIPLLAGQIGAGIGRRGSVSVVVTRSLMRRIEGRGLGLGDVLRAPGLGENGVSLKVTGVVADHRFADPLDPDPEVIYLPVEAFPVSKGWRLTEGRPPEVGLFATARERAISWESYVRRAERPYRRGFTLLATVAGLTLFVGAAGAFGAGRYVRESRREALWVKRALGGPPLRLVFDLLKIPLASVARGTVIGLGIAVATGWWGAWQSSPALFLGVSAIPPVTYGLAALLGTWPWVACGGSSPHSPNKRRPWRFFHSTRASGTRPSSTR